MSQHSADTSRDISGGEQCWTWATRTPPQEIHCQLLLIHWQTIENEMTNDSSLVIFDKGWICTLQYCTVLYSRELVFYLVDCIFSVDMFLFPCVPYKFKSEIFSFAFVLFFSYKRMCFKVALSQKIVKTKVMCFLDAISIVYVFKFRMYH